MERKLTLLVCVFSLTLRGTACAIPPLVTGDAPVAEKSHVELYVGYRYQKTDVVERQVPFTELVYGLSERQEITFEVPYLSTEGSQGFGDAVIGTKYLFLEERSDRPGVAGSFEVKLDNAGREKGLGTGALEYELRLRAQKEVSWFTGIVNLGHTFVGEPEANGVRVEKRNTWFTAFAQEYAITPASRLLSEVYYRTSDEPGGPYRLAAGIGFKTRVSDSLSVHSSVGKSLREANRGGPGLRFYAGFKYEFPAGNNR
ncbi:MAG: transporter [Deltaproteobacteria bacterium]|nr:transporter [Deltaproteobacteria bacterium]